MLLRIPRLHDRDQLWSPDVVGGPHLYSTFGYTLADRAYRKRYGWRLLPCILIPIGVVWLRARTTSCC
jgi:hypothetical protein